mgnify:CR=1 FL=1
MGERLTLGTLAALGVLAVLSGAWCLWLAREMLKETRL